MGEGTGPSPSSLANQLVRAARTTFTLSWVLPSFGARGAALGLEDVAPRTLVHTRSYAAFIDAVKTTAPRNLVCVSHCSRLSLPGQNASRAEAGHRVHEPGSVQGRAVMECLTATLTLSG